MQLVFIHGWGMNSTIWQSTIEALPDYECRTIDLGFIKGGETQAIEQHKPTIVIGHSLGTLWFLKNYFDGNPLDHNPLDHNLLDNKPLESDLRQLNLMAFVSIGGFTNFTSFTPKATLTKMQDGLASNPATQMALFWRRAGCKNFAPSENLAPRNLSQGLKWLANWNGAEKAVKLECPKLILASKADKIVPVEATREQWQTEEIIWHETAPHCLQLAEPKWVAKMIKQQAQAL